MRGTLNEKKLLLKGIKDGINQDCDRAKID
jgi:hypothetical protein